MINDFGDKINKLRKEKNMTLKDLSEKCNLSVAFLSQIERGLAAPAIVSLDTIAEALDVDFSYFFNMPRKEKKIVNRSYNNNPLVIDHSNFIYNELSTHLKNRKMEAMHVTILPGKEENYPAVGEHKGEEFIYVIEGLVTLIYGEQEMDLYPGDSAHYNSNVPHSWRNNTNKIAKLISVNTPLIFRDYREI
ncbi:MAG: helix-turn-helix transcriptional regulator [Tissierellales bacterium]|jgi:transcriptional regulator with XRE-family HTH domain|nr:helix-turn-helix transcriptional regulator [Tissierellales bacterium]